MKIINFEKKKTTPLTNEQQESYEPTKICNIYKIKIKQKYTNDKIYCKVKDRCHYTGKYKGDARSICNLKYSLPKVIPVNFNIGSKYDCYFITNELAKEF